MEENIFFWDFFVISSSQQRITCSKLAIEAQEKVVKTVQKFWKLFNC